MPPGGWPRTHHRSVRDPRRPRGRGDQPRREYAEAKIPGYWIDDPEAQRITVLALTADGYEERATLLRGEALHAVTLPGLTVDVGVIFDAE